MFGISGGSGGYNDFSAFPNEFPVESQRGMESIKNAIGELIAANNLPPQNVGVANPNGLPFPGSRRTDFDPSSCSQGNRRNRPNRDNMGVLERLGFKYVDERLLESQGQDLNVAYHKRTGDRCVAEVTGGPPEMVGFTTDPIHRNHNDDWKKDANQQIRDQHKRVDPPPVMPYEVPSNQQPKSDTDGHQQQEVLERFKDLTDALEVTATEKRSRKEENAKKTIKKKREVDANPSSTPKEKEKALKKQEDAVDEHLEQVAHDKKQEEKRKVAHGNKQEEKRKQEEVSYQEQAISNLNGVTKNCEKQVNQAQAKIAKGEKCHRKANKMSKAAKKIEKQLNSSDKVTVKDKNGRAEKVSKEEAQKIAKKLNNKSAALQQKGSRLKRNGRVSAAYNSAKGSAAKELSNQVKDAKATLVTGAALSVVDGVFDVLEGKCDASTAAKNAFSTTVGGVTTHVVSSVAYEGIKGAITATVNDVGDKLPGLGNVMKAYTAASIVINAENAAAAANGLQDFTVDTIGETVAIATVGFFTGPVPAMIGGKVLWRGGKSLWGHAVKWYWG